MDKRHFRAHLQGVGGDPGRTPIHPRWRRCSSLKYRAYDYVAAPCQRGASTPQSIDLFRGGRADDVDQQPKGFSSSPTVYEEVSIERKDLVRLQHGCQMNQARVGQINWDVAILPHESLNGARSVG